MCLEDIVPCVLSLQFGSPVCRCCGGLVYARDSGVLKRCKIQIALTRTHERDPQRYLGCNCVVI